MSLEKGIQYGKEHRKSYSERGLPGDADWTCRSSAKNHPLVCTFCQKERLLASRKVEDGIKLSEKELDEFFKDKKFPIWD